MATPVKTAKQMFDQFLTKADPESATPLTADAGDTRRRVALASKGGHARNAALSPRKRRQIAKKAASERWKRG
jgi:hypothetical protein